MKSHQLTKKTSLRVRSRTWAKAFLVCSLFCAILVLAQLAALETLTYRTSLFEYIDPSSALRHPNPDFTLGVTNWDVKRYSTDSHLKPLRLYFSKFCGTKEGLDAGLCVSNQFASQFPFGSQVEDFHDAGYDVVKDFQSHISGEPGHCVARSGLMAAVLLSVGIPARVVQLLPLDNSGGHNITELWDKKYGWVLVDPSTGGVVGNRAGPCSAVALLRSPDSVQWLGGGHAPINGLSPVDLYETNYRLFQGHLLYPEPWLYIRVGDRASYWPYRGKFVHVGPWQWKLGPGQTILRYGILIFSIISLSCLVATVMVMWINRRTTRVTLEIGSVNQTS